MSQIKRKFDQFDYKHTVTASASQCETADDCLRKWWFAKCHKLREPLKDQSEKGDVFHEVCERWLEADDTGRVNGVAVDPFPEGWDDRISPVDSAVARVVFKQFVERGVLVRTPGRVIEAAFQLPVLPNRAASMIGFIDIMEPVAIVDHKTTGAPRYMKTPQGLAENLQMCIYGCALIADYIKRGETPPETIKLRHNQAYFPKPHEDTDPFVKYTEVDVTPEYLTEFWDNIVVPIVEMMVEWKKKKIPVDDWGTIPGPKHKGTCKKYGGCPYKSICAGTQTVEAYRAFVARQQKQHLLTVEINTETMSNTNDILAKLAAKKNKAAKPATPTPAPDPEPEVEEVQPEALTGDCAPWANPDCLACKGIGVNKDGNACQPCQAATDVSAEGFSIEPGDGCIDIIGDGDEIVASILVTGDVTEKKARTVAKVDAAPATPKETTKAKNAAKNQATTDKAEKKSATRGRPKQGFTLIYGVQKRGKAKCIDMEQVLMEYGKLLAEEWAAAGYYACDAFKRRDALAHKAEAIAETFGAAIVQVTSDSPDVRALAAALEPFASSVFVGVSK